MSENKNKKPTQTFDLFDCDEDDVICFGEENIYKIAKLRAAVYNINFCRQIFDMLSKQGIEIDPKIIGITNSSEYYLNLLRGFDFEILQQSGGGWKKCKFKMKITLETWDDEEKPEKSESPLDDIRRSLE